MNELFLRNIARKVDVLLWIFAVPLIPMIIAEFFTELSPEAQIYFKSYYFILWVVFTFEFLIKLFLEKNKVEYLKTNWLDVLVVLTPAFRTFKVFHFVRFPVLLLSDRILQALSTLGMNFLYYLIFVSVVVLVGADLTLFFEQQSENANIHTFGDAIWWTISSLTTAGGGDSYPVTAGGQTVAVVLMTIGFAVFSILIASLVSFFMKEYSRTAKDDNLLEGIGDQLGLAAITDRLERIERSRKNGNNTDSTRR